MQLLLFTFSERIGPFYSYISYNEVVQRFNSNRLSPVLANAIAAAVVPWALASESATGLDRIVMSKLYSKKAKASILKVPSVRV
jgi:hypothetical protein